MMMMIIVTRKTVVGAYVLVCWAAITRINLSLPFTTPSFAETADSEKSHDARGPAGRPRPNYRNVEVAAAAMRPGTRRIKFITTLIRAQREREREKKREDEESHYMAGSTPLTKEAPLGSRHKVSGPYFPFSTFRRYYFYTHPDCLLLHLLLETHNYRLKLGSPLIFIAKPPFRDGIFAFCQSPLPEVIYCPKGKGKDSETASTRNDTYCDTLGRMHPHHSSSYQRKGY